jgi:hypothetical protein
VLGCLQGDFKDVSKAELRRLGAAALAADPAATADALLARAPPGYRGFTLEPGALRDDAVKAGVATWGAMMARGQWLGDLLRGREVVAVLGEGACRTLFVHAGLTKELLQVRPLACARVAVQALLSIMRGMRMACDASSGHKDATQATGNISARGHKDATQATGNISARAVSVTGSFCSVGMARAQRVLTLSSASNKQASVTCSPCATTPPSTASACPPSTRSTMSCAPTCRAATARAAARSAAPLRRSGRSSSTKAPSGSARSPSGRSRAARSGAAGSCRRCWKRSARSGSLWAIRYRCGGVTAGCLECPCSWNLLTMPASTVSLCPGKTAPRQLLQEPDTRIRLDAIMH